MPYGREEEGSPVTGLMSLASVPDRVGRLYSLLGDFCHDLRNRLHSLNMTLYLARRSGALGPEEGARLEARYRRIEQHLDQLQWVCKPAELKLMRLDLGLLLEERRSSWAERFAARGCDLDTAIDAGHCEGLFDPCRISTALEALAGWRAEVVGPGMTVEVGTRVDGDQFIVTWAEAGGGRRELDPATEGPGLLALGMLGRVMADHRGTIRVSDGDDFGVSLRWPILAGDRRASLPSRPAGRAALTARVNRA